MVNHPREYQWSSYRSNAEGEQNALIEPHEEYLKLDHNELPRRKAYRELFKAHVDDIDNRIRRATNGNFVLGNSRFQEQIEMALGRRVTRGKAGRPRKEQNVD